MIHANLDEAAKYVSAKVPDYQRDGCFSLYYYPALGGNEVVLMRWHYKEVVGLTGHDVCTIAQYNGKERFAEDVALIEETFQTV